MAPSAVSDRTLPLEWPLVGRHEEVDLFRATLADEHAHGFVIYGSAGVGKTRLADHCLSVAQQSGRDVARVTATEGARAVPLGVLAHLLPPGLAIERGNLATIIAAVRSMLSETVPTGSLVLFVDDLHLVDATSATLLTQLIDADLVFLVATVRGGEAMPPGLDALWQRARVRRVDLDEFDRLAVETLLHIVLRDPVEAATSAQLWTASQGNVLFVRELVLGALGRGQLVQRHGVWRLKGPIVTTQRLHELIALRLVAVGEAATAALDVLAVWEPAALSMLEAAVGREQLDRLDRGGLLEVRADGRRHSVRLAHPLYGEIVRARMPALTRRRLLLELADRLEAYGGRRREDPIRIATARLDATGSAEPALLVRAARLARYGQDFVQVERFGRAAAADAMTPEVGLLLGEALHELGRWIEADDVLGAAEASAGSGDDDLLVLIAEMRSRNLMWGLQRDDEALAANRAARDRLGDDDDADELTLNEALLLTHCGRPLDALAVLDRIDRPLPPRSRSLRAFAELPALAVTGRCATAASAAAPAGASPPRPSRPRRPASGPAAPGAALWTRPRTMPSAWSPSACGDVVASSFRSCGAAWPGSCSPRRSTDSLGRSPLAATSASNARPFRLGPPLLPVPASRPMSVRRRMRPRLVPGTASTFSPSGIRSSGTSTSVVVSGSVVRCLTPTPRMVSVLPAVVWDARGSMTRYRVRPLRSTTGTHVRPCSSMTFSPSPSSVSSRRSSAAR